MIFIDTENTFRPERIHQIAENRGITEPENVRRKIYVCKIFYSGHLELIIQNLGRSIQEYKASLIRLAEAYNIAVVNTNIQVQHSQIIFLVEVGISYV